MSVVHLGDGSVCNLLHTRGDNLIGLSVSPSAPVEMTCLSARIIGCGIRGSGELVKSHRL